MADNNSMFEQSFGSKIESIIIEIGFDGQVIIRR